MRIRMAALAAVLCGVLLTASAYSNGASITVGEVTAVAGGMAQIPVTLSAATDLAGVNIRVTYDPAVFSGPSADKGALLGADHQLASHSPENGKFNVVAYSPSGVGPFTAQSGVAFNIKLDVSASAVAGSYDIAFADPITGPPDTPASGLSDTVGTSIDHTAAKGKVTITVSHAISGVVKEQGTDNPIEGALVSASNGGSSTMSVVSGAYSVMVPDNWTGQVTASKTGYVFTAKDYTTPVTSDQTEQDFVGTPAAETVSTPNTPSGPATGVTGVSYTFSTGGSTSSLGNPVEYRFIWGDGQMSDYSSTASAEHAWTTTGTVTVKAQARSATNPDVLSAESAGAQIAISEAQVASILYNISTRGQVGNGDSQMFAGFIIEGDSTKTVAVTGWGPRLADFGVTNVLADPLLTVYLGADALGTCDDWKTSPYKSLLEGLNLAPKYDKESGVVISLPAGEYTAILSGKDNPNFQNGIVAVWDGDTAHSELVNISTRGWVGTGADQMFAGFIIQGSSAKKVAVTGWGPRLADFGVQNVLADPTLTVYQGETALGTSDNWKTSPYKDEVTAAGLEPKYDNESAIVLTLNPGEYTAILSGVSNTVGNAIVAVWAVRSAE